MLCCWLQVFVYLAGLQLLLTSGRKSVLVMVASTLAGVLYRLNLCGVRRLRVSSSSCSTCCCRAQHDAAGHSRRRGPATQCAPLISAPLICTSAALCLWGSQHGWCRFMQVPVFLHTRVPPVRCCCCRYLVSLCQPAPSYWARCCVTSRAPPSSWSAAIQHKADLQEQGGCTGQLLVVAASTDRTQAEQQQLVGLAVVVLWSRPLVLSAHWSPWASAGSRLWRRYSRPAMMCKQP